MYNIIINMIHRTIKTSSAMGQNLKVCSKIPEELLVTDRLLG